MTLWSKPCNRLCGTNFVDKIIFSRSNESKSLDTFNYDIETVNKNIQQIVGESLNNADTLEDLQDEYDNLKDSNEVLGNMLSTAR